MPIPRNISSGIQLDPGSMEVVMKVDVGDTVLLPIPPRLLGLEASLELDNLIALDEIPSNFGPQKALVVRTLSRNPSVIYRWTITNEQGLPDWIWSPPDHPLNRASPELRDYVCGLIDGHSEAIAVRKIMHHVAEVFYYGHGDGRFTDGENEVPLVSCGLTRGTCVDIHTYASAALRAGSVLSAYVAGVFWPEGKNLTTDMHCWLLVRETPATNWDIAHDLIALRAPQADLLALPGVRFPLSVGRGLKFRYEGSELQISHFALPLRVQTEGASVIPTSLFRL